MKSLLRYKYILLPRLHSKTIISRLSTVSKTDCSLNKDGISESKISTLFVPGRLGGNIYHMVKPIIDLKYIEDNATMIERSCQARRVDLDVQSLLETLKEWAEKRDKHQSLSKQYKDLKEEADRYKALDFPENANALIEQSNEVLDKIKSAREEVYDIEDIAMPLIAKVPNFLDPLTPLIHDSVKVHVEPLNNSRSLSHVEILSKNLSLLEFINVSPTAYYLKGPLAELEMSLQVYFSDKLQELDFAPMSCGDFVKAFILEATGLDPLSCDECIPLKKNKASSNVIQNINLVGGASFQSFCAYLVNINSCVETLPLRYYSLGRHYDAGKRHTKDPSLFSVVQSSSIHSLIINDPETSITEFDMLLQTLIDCYTYLKIPFRVVDISAPRLKCTESRRVQVELWSPALLNYVPVAYASQHNDFVSKRLHISFGKGHNIKGYCNIVEGTVVNVPVLLGCLVENHAKTNGSVDFDKLFQLLDPE